MRFKLFLVHVFYKIKTWWPLWFYVVNYKARKKFNTHKPNLSSLGKRIQDELDHEGIAITTLDELFPNENMLEKLLTYKNSLDLNNVSTHWKKEYLKNYWDKLPVFDATNPFVQFILSEKITSIVNSYMSMWTKLGYYDLSLTLPVGRGANPIRAQRWHRDPDEKRLLKVFIYLSDVDTTAGPFTYIKKSTYGNKYGSLFPQKTPAGIYPDEHALLAKIDQDDIKEMTAPKGTVIFCDTSGFHKGGYATEKERLMFTGFYSAPSYHEARYYTLPPSFDQKEFSPEVAFALGK